MKAKTFLIALIAIFSVLTVNAEDGDEQTDENTIETSSESTTTKPHYAPRYHNVKNVGKTTSDALYIKFSSDVNDVTISIYKDGVEVVNNYEGDVSYGTVLPFYLSQYGLGTYEVYVLSAADIITSGEIGVVEQ